MKRYVDIDQLIEQLGDEDVMNRRGLEQWAEENAEPDVVQVVRCKDCRWLDRQSHDLCCIHFIHPDSEYFCCEGAR